MIVVGDAFFCFEPHLIYQWAKRAAHRVLLPRVLDLLEILEVFSQ